MHLSGLRWGYSDFWLPVEAGKNWSSSTSPHRKPYPLPSDLQRDEVTVPLNIISANGSNGCPLRKTGATTVDGVVAGTKGTSVRI